MAVWRYMGNTITKLSGVVLFLTFVACQSEHKVPTETSRYWHAYGVEALKDKRYQEAIVHLQKAASEDATFALPHRHLGVAFAKTGNKAAAVAHYRLYLTLQQDARDAAQVKDTIAELVAQESELAQQAHARVN